MSGEFVGGTELNRLLDNVGALLPGLTTDVLTMVCWNTIEDFYLKSTYQRQRIDWTMPGGTTVLNFDPVSPLDGGDTWRVCRFLGFEGLGRVRFEPPGKIYDMTHPVPDSERKGVILLALKPNSFNTILPYDVWTTYFETLMNGALSRLYLQPGKPYSDANAAVAHGRMYRSGIASARADVQAGHIRDGASWTFPYFAAGGHANGRGIGQFSEP